MFSVIVPVYNVAPYLRRCIDSLLAQTFTDYELILVDDGSTDGSGDICEEYVNANPNANPNLNENDNPNPNGNGNEDANENVKVKVRVNVIHQPNAGVSAARNRGIEAAQGEYIAFVDADDWVEPDFLAAFSDNLNPNLNPNLNENDGSTGSPQVNENGNGRGVDCVVQGFIDYEGHDQAGPEVYYQTGEELCAHLFELEEKQLIGYVWNKVFRRALIEEHHIRFNPELPIGEDGVFVMTFFTHATSLVCTSHAGYHYLFNREKNYSFIALDKRLDSYYNLICSMPLMPSEVKSAFLFHEFRFSLYILHVLYREAWSSSERLYYLRKIRSRVQTCKPWSLCSLEHPYIWLALMVIYFPVVMSDLLLKFIVFHSHK